MISTATPIPPGIGLHAPILSHFRRWTLRHAATRTVRCTSHADMTPDRFARGYLAFLEDAHRRGAEQILLSGRLDAYRLVLGWFGEQDGMPEERFTRLLTDRATTATNEHVRWICGQLAILWRMKQLRSVYAGRWADGADAGFASDAPWDQPVLRTEDE